MRLPLLPLIILLAFNALVDGYIYMALHSYLRRRVWSTIHAWSSVVLAIALVVVMLLPVRGGDNNMLLTIMWMLFAYLSIYIAKIIFVISDILSRIPLIFRRKRARWLTSAGAVLGVVVFGSMWWGALLNRYNIETRHVTVRDETLPKGLDGLRIAQISDLHVGTYGDNTAFMQELVDSINALHPDVIVFTGDIVNRRSDELKPFVGTLCQLRAPLGVYGVLGNHDYGDYCNWPSEEAKAADYTHLNEMLASMNWKMLNNSHVFLKQASDSLVLIGVENVGDPPFRTYGDLKKAYPTPSDSRFKVLLSHNPAHWDMDIQDVDSMNIALTLSGHTHAMQIEMADISPAALRYKHWGGLYEDGNHRRLYVNVGAGTVGFPARIGANPEITLITLKS